MITVRITVTLTLTLTLMLTLTLTTIHLKHIQAPDTIFDDVAKSYPTLTAAPPLYLSSCHAHAHYYIQTSSIYMLYTTHNTIPTALIIHEFAAHESLASFCG